MKQKYRNLADDLALQRLEVEPRTESVIISYGQWIRTLRNYLRMTQQELAQRSHIPQSHLALIESGKIDPQIGTLQRIFDGLSCDLVIEPRPRRPLSAILRGRARSIALKRLTHTMGTMALEDQAPEQAAFTQLLEKRTDEILGDSRERLWNKNDA